MKPVTNWNTVPVIMTLDYAACLLNKSVDTLKHRAGKGDFPAFKDGGTWRVRKDDLITYIEHRKATPSDGAPIRVEATGDDVIAQLTDALCRIERQIEQLYQAVAKGGESA